jgi:hypothetical protein
MRGRRFGRPRTMAKSGGQSRRAQWRPWSYAPLDLQSQLHCITATVPISFFGQETDDRVVAVSRCLNRPGKGRNESCSES